MHGMHLPKRGKQALGRIIADEVSDIKPTLISSNGSVKQLLSTSTLPDDVSGAVAALTDTTTMPSVDAAVLNERDVSTDTPSALIYVATSPTADSTVLTNAGTPSRTTSLMTNDSMTPSGDDSSLTGITTTLPIDVTTPSRDTSMLNGIVTDPADASPYGTPFRGWSTPNATGTSLSPRSMNSFPPLTKNAMNNKTNINKNLPVSSKSSIGNNNAKKNHFVRDRESAKHKV
ncbi:hypothetical protein J6590_078448 [Homalodisca vitripennis]|nr:hypothetical protein J6590_078448 [Homalodisca vitripennis]